MIWKIFGRRLDGWTNADHPTESVPGDASTLPPGANPNEADLDFTGTIMPPPESGYPPLSEDEKILFARWVDLGCPVEFQSTELKKYGWFADDLRPTLTLSQPRAGRNTEPLSEIRIGAFDYYSGLNRASFSVKADFEVYGLPAGIELASLLIETGDHIWTLPLETPVTDLNRGTLTVSVEDATGNITKLERSFSIKPTGDGPKLLNPKIHAGLIEFVLKGASGQRYAVQGSGDLSAWNTLTELTLGAEEQTHFEPISPSEPIKFYRIVEQ